MRKEKSVLRRVQLTQLEILGQIDNICSKYGLKYQLAYGSLLGAIRHGGFIPWDDDKVPGCIETFDEGLTGIGFEPRNVDSLVEAINKFAEIPYEKKVEMGKNARLKVEKEYDRNIVVNASLKEIENILN